MDKAKWSFLSWVHDEILSEVATHFVRIEIRAVVYTAVNFGAIFNVL